jgi:hypothetical protein
LTEDEGVQEQGGDGDILPKRVEVTGDWQQLHNEERNCYSLLNIIRVIKCGGLRWKGHVAGSGEKRNVYRVVVNNVEGNRLLGIEAYIRRSYLN